MFQALKFQSIIETAIIQNIQNISEEIIFIIVHSILRIKHKNV